MDELLLSYINMFFRRGEMNESPSTISAAWAKMMSEAQVETYTYGTIGAQLTIRV